MYYCYLRAKQYELLAVRSCLAKIVQKNMVAIIEPVRESDRDLYNCLRDARDNNARVILIVNPKCGELEGNERAAETLINGAIEINPQIELGYIVDDTTSSSQVTNFFNIYQNQNKSIIHNGRYANAQQLLQIESSDGLFKDNIFIDGACSTTYISNFNSTSKVLIRDGLNRAQTNAGYANNIIEFFSDLHLNYRQLGFNGFGDFSIVGNHFAEGGGQAITAVIHITYENIDRTEIQVHHFLSDPRVVVEDVAILIDEALEKLDAFLSSQRPDILNWSTACRELVDIYNTPSVRTNLAYIKKMSIKHHFELMHDIL
ncbi:sce7725 family protein [Cronobacter turicensis]|uniref:sce7725 family protein n=1 Tax=Cronobacter turicensis TaxID=413502 RepID=UPI0024C2AC22|nr:sce7725 family protein [Cronobacter turicensis]MDK1186989.1 sce7725 family protein [Cronobacter turicensis]MDK1206143.1 sce7725 family protein [Cronobacter turicensis]MDK1216298.1 sce7725 family protein [Cronobacter turicensis]MDK1218886.1 sce7725 family protein [Cronobacter turicensis]MDK1231215.1 sce7725 family protein [Cronobacter turicensis]